jgi:HK97 gp10 family phage protein
MGLTSRLPEIIAGLESAMREVELAGAEKIAEAARERVPFDPDTPEHLRDHIHVKETEEGVYVVAGDNEAFWGDWVEHGTVHSAAQPFLVPSLEENRAPIEAAALAAIRKLT